MGSKRRLRTIAWVSRAWHVWLVPRNRVATVLRSPIVTGVRDSALSDRPRRQLGILQSLKRRLQIGPDQGPKRKGDEHENESGATVDGDAIKGGGRSHAERRVDDRRRADQAKDHDQNRPAEAETGESILRDLSQSGNRQQGTKAHHCCAQSEPTRQSLAGYGDREKTRSNAYKEAMALTTKT